MEQHPTILDIPGRDDYDKTRRVLVASTVASRIVGRQWPRLVLRRAKPIFPKGGNMAASPLSHRTLYLQVRDALIRRIANGDWKPGLAIPNEADLAREIGVSGGTVGKALKLMEAEGLVTRRQGRGTYIRDQSSNELAGRFSKICASTGERVHGSVGAQSLTEGVANDQECRRLGLSLGDAVYRIDRVRGHGGQSFSVEHATLPAALFPDLASKAEIAHGIGALAQQYQLLLGKGEERISTVVPAAAIADSLNIASDTPVMRLDRIVFMLDGPAVEWQIAHCRLDGGYYLVEMT